MEYLRIKLIVFLTVVIIAPIRSYGQCENTTHFEQVLGNSNYFGPFNGQEIFYEGNNYMFYSTQNKLKLWGETINCDGCVNKKSEFFIFKQNESGDIVKRWNSEKPIITSLLDFVVADDTVYALLKTYGDTLFFNKKKHFVENDCFYLLRFTIDLEPINAVPLIASSQGGGMSSRLALHIESKIYLAVAANQKVILGTNMDTISLTNKDYSMAYYTFNKSGKFINHSSFINDDFIQILELNTVDDIVLVTALVNNEFYWGNKRISGISGETNRNETDLVVFKYKDTSLINYFQIGSAGSEAAMVYDFNEKNGVLMSVACGSNSLMVNNKSVVQYKSPYNNAILTFDGNDVKVLKAFESPEIKDLEQVYPRVGTANYLSNNVVVASLVYNDTLITSTQKYISNSKVKSRARSNSILITFRNDSIKSTLPIESDGYVSCGFSGVNGNNELVLFGYANDTVRIAKEQFDYFDHLFQINLCLDSFNTQVEKVVAKNRELLLYPNPVIDVLNIKGGTVQKTQVYNYMGQEVVHFTNTNQLDFSGVKSGVYLAILSLKNNQQIKKVIIKQ